MCDLTNADKTNLAGDHPFVNAYVQKLTNQDGKESCLEQDKDDENMDAYISGLQRKYLKNDKGDCSNNKKCENSMDLIRGVLSCSPSSMLNESERNHYTRAMEELRVLLDLSQKKLAESKLDSVQSKIADMESSKKGVMKADQYTVVEEEVTDDTLTQSITLPTGLQSTLTTTATTNNQSNIHSKTKKSVRISLESNDFCDLMKSEYNEDDVEDDDSLTEASAANEEEVMIPAPKMEEADARAIHQELMTIHAKLNVKSQNLNEAYRKMAEREESLIAREAELVEREQMVEDRERREDEEKGKMTEAVTKNMINKLNEVEADVRRKMKSMQMNHSEETAAMRESAEEKRREMKRMKSSFDALKQQNDDLRFDSKSLREENERVRSQNLKLRKRLENLQRKMEFDSRKKSNMSNNVLLEAAPSCTSIHSDGGNESETKNSTSASVTKTSLLDKKLATRCVTALSVSLEWICQVHLKPSTLKQQQVASSLYASEEYLTDRCLKLLPLMVEVFRHIPLTSTTIVRQQLTFLRFVYWSLLHLDEVNQTVLATTSRRIGEELVRSGRCDGQDKSLLLMTGLDATSSSSSAASTSNKPCYKHSNVELRILSCLVILHTLNQADILAKVLEQLRRDLKSEENRALFIDYQATRHVLVPYLTHKSNKTLTTMVVDIMLQLSMESNVMDEFLSQCSNEKWFKSIATTLHSLNHNPRNTDQVVFEKLVVILQKLSKVKSNRKFFDSFALSGMLQDKFRACPIQEHQFLHINLRSILSNLNMIKPNSSSTR